MLLLIPLLPFAGFLANAALGRRLPKSISGGIACLAMIGAFLVSVVSAWPLLGHGGHPVEQVVYTWMSSGSLHVPIEDAPIFRVTIELDRPPKRVQAFNQSTVIKRKGARVEATVSDIHEVLQFRY